MALHPMICSTYRRFKDFGVRSFRILAEAARRFNEVDAGEAAGSMAYFAVFSLFPLLLVLVVSASFVLESEEAQQKVLEFVTKGIPIPQEIIERNIHRLFELRGTVGIAGMIGLLWSATGFFTTLAYQLNRAWPHAESRGFLGRRLVALGIVSALAGLLAFSLVATTLVRLLPHFIMPLWGRVSSHGILLWMPLSKAIPLLLTFLMLLGLYRWVPNTEVKWKEALTGALVAVLGVEITTAAFAWYLRSGLARYRLIYGSLGAMVALMLWIYLNSLITLFGAHLSAAIAQQTRFSKHKAQEEGVTQCQ